MSQDNIFQKKIEKQFQFDENVASVFDDMLNRSVPFYNENIDLIVQIIEKYIQENEQILDLGCSTASLLLTIEKKINKKLKLTGFDNSKAMLEQAEKKLQAFNSKIKLIHADILKDSFPKSKIIILNYTLQFIRPIERENFLKKIFNNLADDGLLILSEKIITENSLLNKHLIDIYYNYKKKMGYSDYEIAQKREALENVLIPYTEQENIRLLKSVGFDEVETIFRWANFSTFLVLKNKSDFNL